MLPVFSSWLIRDAPASYLATGRNSKRTMEGGSLCSPFALQTLLHGERLDSQRWAVDPASECLLPVGKNGAAPPPMRIAVRSTAAVDRISGSSDVARKTACLEYAQGAGMWCLFSAGENWAPRVRSAFRLLADSGVGGERSSGWGGFKPPQFEDVSLPEFFWKNSESNPNIGYWMLALFRPGESDRIDWTRGDYNLINRSGRTMAGGLKASSRMVEESSVLFLETEPVGSALNVSLDRNGPPVFRYGAAFAVPIPIREQSVQYLLERPEKPESPAPPVPAPEIPSQPEPEPERPPQPEPEPERPPQTEPEPASPGIPTESGEDV